MNTQRSDVLLCRPIMKAPSERITYKLWVVSLPPDDPVEHQMQNGRVLRFHVACAGLWRVLKRALPDRKHAPTPSSSL